MPTDRIRKSLIAQSDGFPRLTRRERHFIDRLRTLGDYDWRVAETNIWKVERMLLEHPHRKIRTSNRRVEELRRRYRAFKRRFPDRKPTYYKGGDRWTELPEEFGES